MLTDTPVTVYLDFEREAASADEASDVRPDAITLKEAKYIALLKRGVGSTVSVRDPP